MIVLTLIHKIGHFAARATYIGGGIFYIVTVSGNGSYLTREEMYETYTLNIGA